MKILYLSCHETLEYQEVKLLTELGHDVFSYQGAYMYPQGHPTLKRPDIPEMKFDEELANLALQFPKTNIPQNFIDKFDLIIIMHTPTIITENWDRFKSKKVIWRTIGQSTPDVENQIRKMRYDGMKIVRMSPKEENIIGYVGADDIIRFYEDPEDLFGWTGHIKKVINFTQSLKGRRTFCHYDDIMRIIEGFPSLIYGSGNEDLGSLNGGELIYDLQKGALRDNRVFVCAGTWPSPSTLAPMEAMMVGIPVVAIGQKLAEELTELPQTNRIQFYEMQDIIKNGENGFISDNINELRTFVAHILEDEQLAQRISKEERKTAIRLWNKEKIKEQWREFLDKL